MILVTGGTGLLGSHLLYELVREHEEVVALKRPSSDLDPVKKVFALHSEEWEEHFRLIDWVDMDLLDPAGLEHVFLDVDRVYHCAAMLSFNPRDAGRMIDYNVRSTENVVDACMAARVDKLLHVSSSSTIGKAPDGEEANESLIWARTKTSTAYSLSKFRSEMRIWRGIEEGLKAVIVNPTIILGAGHGARGSSAIFDRVNRGLRIAPDGASGYVGVEDVVSVMVQLMESDIVGERFILSSENLAYKQVFEMIAAALDKPRIMGSISQSKLTFLARLDGIRGALTGKRMLTPEHVRSAFSVSRYSNAKILEAMNGGVAPGFEFTPIKKVISRVAESYKQDSLT